MHMIRSTIKCPGQDSLKKNCNVHLDVHLDNYMTAALENEN